MTHALDLISYLLSTTLAFFTTALLVCLLLYCFQIKNYRVRYFLNLLPFGAVILDVLTHEYSIGNWLNPLNCSSCTQKLFLHLFPDTKEYLSTNQISLIRYLSDTYERGYLFIALFGMISTWLILRKLFLMGLEKYHVKSIVKGAEVNQLLVSNPHLKSRLESHKVRIVSSDKIDVPMATTCNAIVVPVNIKNLSQDEFEAVIAHEFTHIYWKDPRVKGLISCFASLFWWIPINSFVKKIEEIQEMACDQEILKYSFSEENLASALVKVASYAKEKKFIHTCFLINKENSTLKRVKAICYSYPKENLSFFQVFIIGAGLLLLCLCTFF